MLIVCCDGLTGFPEAAEATWTGAMVHTCMVHLIRNRMRFVSYSNRKAVATALKPICTATEIGDVIGALENFVTPTWGQKYPASVEARRKA